MGRTSKYSQMAQNRIHELNFKKKKLLEGNLSQTSSHWKRVIDSKVEWLDDLIAVNKALYEQFSKLENQ